MEEVRTQIQFCLITKAVLFTCDVSCLGRHAHITCGDFIPRPCDKFILVYNIAEITVSYIKIKDLFLVDLTIFTIFSTVFSKCLAHRKTKYYFIITIVNHYINNIDFVSGS